MIPAGVRGAKLKDWRERFAKRYGSEDGSERTADAVRKAFQRAKENLLSQNIIRISDPYIWVN